MVHGRGRGERIRKLLLLLVFHGGCVPQKQQQGSELRHSLGACVCLYRVRVNIHLFELSDKTQHRQATLARW